MGIIFKKFTTEEYTVHYFVDEEHDGMRLDQYVQTYLPTWSRQQVINKIKSKEITIFKRPGKTRPSSTVHHKDTIKLITKKTIHEDEYWKGEKLKLQEIPDIVFEDDNIIVISKPPYMSTHPTGKHLFNCATVYFGSKYNRTIHSIHRLDRETSGILLLGKDTKSTAKLTKAFEDDLVKKCYFFIAKKDSFKEENHFTATERMGPLESGLKRVYIHHFPESDTRGKHAKTHFQVLFEESKYAIGLAFPQTGRQHQIRVHAYAHGLPLIGDKLYLGNFKMFQRFKDNIAREEDYKAVDLHRHALHAIALNIPYQDKRETFISKIPDDLKEWLKLRTTIDLKKLETVLSKQIKDYFQET